MKDSESLDQIRQERGADVQRIRSELGEILDASDLLNHHAFQWYLHVSQHRPVPNNLIEDPISCREVVLKGMARETVQTSWDLCQVSRAGVIRATQWLFRKQFETRINALFISLDETGHSAQIYQYLQLINHAKLNTEDENLQEMRRLSVEVLRAKGIDISNQSAWANATNGKSYFNLVSRSDYVSKKHVQIWPDADISEKELNEINQHEKEMYRKSNTVVHPSLIGAANLSDYRLILSSNLMSLMTVLNQYRQTAMWDLPLAAFKDTEEIWEQFSGPYGDISAAIGGKL